MKIKFYGKSKVPVIDVRDSKEAREEVAKVIKASKGKNSKYIPNRNMSRY